MDDYWSYERVFRNYRQNLHKHLFSKYNQATSNDDNTILSNLIVESNSLHDERSPIIYVKSVSFNIEEDGLKHNTIKYELMHADMPDPVFRRGQPFSLNVHFNRLYKPGEDLLHLLAEYGPKASLYNGTRYEVVLSDKAPENDDIWAIWAMESEGPDLNMMVQTPVNCQVGPWKFTIVTYKKDTAGQSKYNLREDIYILFNPWHNNDDVFLNDEQKREEYVMNDHGTMYMGTNRDPSSYPWVFNQFDLVVLPVLALLMEVSDTSHSQRGSPILMSRAMSAVINSYDDQGLLMGKWDNDFKDGTNPISWSGSASFFQEYIQNTDPVKYAQCWVYAGAITTACRALGIPCRPVTCFACAHDTNNTLTIDKFFSKTGKLIKGGNDGTCNDSIWNFHCWNEVWMSRPDLPPGYGGWQAIDGTPQEISNNLYRVGPTSLRAIKEGNVGFLYDTGFLFSEVNADVFHFQEDSTTPFGYSRVKMDTTRIGKRVVTQSLYNNIYGEREMEDITHLYKSPEGSEAERAATFNALRAHPRAQKYYKAVQTQVTRDVFFKISEVGVVFFGETFSATLTIENHAAEQRTIKTTLSAVSVLYTGKIADTIEETNVEITLNPKEARTVKIQVSPEKYMSKVSRNMHIKVTAVSNVVETGQTFMAEDDFEVTTKKLEIKAPDAMKVGMVSQSNFYFTNPLSTTLTQCALIIEGPGLKRPKTVNLSDVPPNGQFKHSESLVPKKTGSHVIIVTFNSDQMIGVKGYKNVNVEK